MTNILIHGLGQNEAGWNEVKKQLSNNGIKVETPNLFFITRNCQVNYENMYEAFAAYCNSFNEKVNLVGLSLGGILALDYTAKFPEKVNSMMLIGTPYEIPKKMLKLQNFIFKFMPKKQFESMGIQKNDFINLTNSMAELDIKSKTSQIKCNTFILCGEKDSVNIESAKQLHRNISGSKLEIIKNAGHEVNIDNPIELSELISEYWK